jgi:hypothetical protein
MSNALFVTWRSGTPQNGSWGPVGKLEHVDGLYRFTYTKGAQTLPGFQPFPGMPNVWQVYEAEQLFPIFANRLLSKSRPEYEAYLTWGGFDPGNPPEPLAILGVTEGIRQTDSLELFPCPAPDAEGCFLTKFFLHGLRWMPVAAIERVGQLRAGDQLALMLDLFNPFDQAAIAIRTTDERDRYLIGYVPRYLARDVGSLCQTCHPNFVEVRVERVNVGAPLQMRLLCRMGACWPEGFQPCAGEEFQLLVHPAGCEQGTTRA